MVLAQSSRVPFYKSYNVPFYMGRANERDKKVDETLQLEFRDGLNQRE